MTVMEYLSFISQRFCCNKRPTLQNDFRRGPFSIAIKSTVKQYIHVAIKAEGSLKRCLNATKIIHYKTSATHRQCRRIFQK